MTSSTTPKILLLGKVELPEAQQAYAELSTLATLVTSSATSRAEFVQQCRSGTFAGVKAVYRTFDSFKVTGRLDDELARILGREGVGVRFICHNGAGYDQIDIPAYTAAGIQVSHTPTAVDAATADTALFLLLGALRLFNAPLLALRAGSWRGGPPLPPLGHDPEGKLLGILGMGGIGRELKKKVEEALGMKVQYHNRRELGPKLAAGAKYVSFEDLLATSDVISLNLPLNPATRHILSTNEFEQMKPGVVIINTSRGAVIDEAALVAALASGKVYSAGLDVYEHEPNVHPGLMGNEKVLLLPHMGTWTVETQLKMELWTIANLRAALETGKLKSRVPEQEGEDEALALRWDGDGDEE